MKELNILLHLEPFKVVNLPSSTLGEFLKLTSRSIRFSNNEIKPLNLLAELCSFVNCPRTLCSVVVCLWTFHFYCISTILQEGKRKKEIQASYFDYLLTVLTKYTLSCFSVISCR